MARRPTHPPTRPAPLCLLPLAAGAARVQWQVTAPSPILVLVVNFQDYVALFSSCVKSVGAGGVQRTTCEWGAQPGRAWRSVANHCVGTSCALNVTKLPQDEK